jgi:two-component system sensor histidine kinase KdpD
MHPLSSNHHIFTEIDPDLPLITTDEVLLRQAIFNIVHNALVHTPAASKIWIKAAKIGNKIEIAIEDNGSGISGDDLPNIFQKFYRSPSVKEHGIGLGLSIARGFVEANNGTVQVENRIEGGARFKIIFPLSDNNLSKV